MNRIMSIGTAIALVIAGAAGRAEATEYIYTLIDYPGATHSYAWGINDSGQIVGEYEVGGRSHGFTWSGGVFTSFDHPTAASGGSGASDVNNSGQIVGWYDTPGSNTRGAYLRDGNEYHALTPFGSDWTEAWGINDSASVVGFYTAATGVNHGFLFDGTSYTTFDDPDAVTTFAKDINNTGVIVGSGWESAGYPHGFIRDANGTFSKFMVSGYGTDANGVNDLGQIVGDYGPSPAELYGYVLSGGIGATPEMLVVRDSTYTIALDINNLGRVVGFYQDASSTYRGFLATPIAAADFDRDGDVDGADLALWEGDYGLNANCDADGDGDTDGRDFLVWQRQYTGSRALVGATSSAVPEPASLCLMLMALAGSTLAARNTF